MENLTMARDQVKIGLEDEAALVQSARRDPEAFSKLYHHYVAPVYRYLYKWLGNAKDAEDLTSQVFIDVLEGLVHYRERGNFAAWLFTIARRKAIAVYRQQRPTRPLEEVDNEQASTEDPLEEVEQNEQKERMAVLFAELAQDERELLRLRFTVGLSYAEIGALLGRGEAAVKMAIYRLLRRMHKKWEVK